MGRCPSCGEWNTYTEEVIERETRSNGWNNPAAAPRKGSKESRLVRDIQTAEIQRVGTGNNELHRV
ncbi:MAG: DNA repair protein RadA, partial [Bacteroidales bacterium]|nr:DNA repair protein RadA [Bacteroidales bacterium]